MFAAPCHAIGTDHGKTFQWDSVLWKMQVGKLVSHHFDHCGSWWVDGVHHLNELFFCKGPTIFFIVLLEVAKKGAVVGFGVQEGGVTDMLDTGFRRDTIFGKCNFFQLDLVVKFSLLFRSD
jgi:hypothetical protein